MIRRPPRSTQSRSSAASDVYKRQRRGVDVGSQQTVLGAHDLEEAPGARVTQPLAERSGEPHLFAVDDFARDEAFDGFLDLSLIHISEPTRLGMISYAVFCL